MKKISLLVLFSLFSCTTMENDRTVNNRGAVFNTRIDFTPLTRKQRIHYSNLEKENARQLEAPLREFLGKMRAERAKYYDSIKKEFPECEAQKHCVSDLTSGKIKKYERYQELVTSLRKYDLNIVDTEARIETIEENLKFKLRYYYNSYLVSELLKVANDRELQSVMVHSLRAFSGPDAIARRLIQYVDRDEMQIEPADMKFRAFGQLVDEAAVVLTLEVWRNAFPGIPKAPRKILVTLLVNTFQLDEQEREETFLRVWRAKLSEPLLTQLRKEAYCGLYSIASDSLASKMQVLKIKPCYEMRTEWKAYSAQKFVDRFMPENWVLPLAYVEM